MSISIWPVVEIVRLEGGFQYGTFGALKINKQVFCVTLEPPDIENIKNISSIPAQQYTCEKFNSPTYGETFIVKDVTNREYVLFHPGNIKRHTKGCIILGQYWGKLGENRAVLNSGSTFKEFLNIMKDYNEFHLTIKEVY